MVAGRHSWQSQRGVENGIGINGYGMMAMVRLRAVGGTRKTQQVLSSNSSMEVSKYVI